MHSVRYVPRLEVSKGVDDSCLRAAHAEARHGSSLLVHYVRTKGLQTMV